MEDKNKHSESGNHIRWISRLFIALILLFFCISCGQKGLDIGLGPPEREIEKMYRPAEAMYNGLLEGKIRSSKQNWKNVIRQFRKIVKDHPKSRFADGAQYNIGSCYIHAHELWKDASQKAIEAFERLMEHYPDSEFVDDACYWKAYAYSLQEDYERAIEEYEKFAREYPQSELRKEALHQIEECRARMTPTEEQDASPDTTEKDVPDEHVSEQPQPPAEDNAATEVKPPAEQPGEISHVTDIRFHSSPEFTRVVVNLSGPVKYEACELKNPDRIYIDLQTAAIVPARRTIQVDDRSIKTIRAAQFNKSTVRIVLDVKPDQSFNVFYLTEPDRIVMDVSRSDVLPQIPPPQSQSESVPLVKQLGLKVKTIVIDPGHGGKDPGAVSESGLQEKELVLDISKQLKSLLESSGAYHVFMTRETDVYLPLKDRTAFANQKGADVFISVHINSSENSSARGIETYYLSLASDEEARMTAALENASSGKTIKDLNNIVRYIIRGAKVKESRELARTIQSQLRIHTGANDRGIRRAPFMVLIGAQAPSILVELGYMSNKQDESLLRSAEYRDKLVRALAEGVKNYVKTIDQAS